MGSGKAIAVRRDSEADSLQKEFVRRKVNRSSPSAEMIGT
jgi:hypothetical protein